MDQQSADDLPGGDRIQIDSIKASNATAVGRGATAVQGKYNLVIGKLVVPGRILIAVALVLASPFLSIAAAGYLLPRFTAPLIMGKDTFNIAVAEFGQLDDTGGIRVTDDSRNLSQWVFQKIAAEYADSPEGAKVLVWHDSLDATRKRSTIGVVQGKSAEDRASAAASLANRLNAQVVIYGNLDVRGDRPNFTPEFYVARVQGDADEIVGPHELGAAILVKPPIDYLGAGHVPEDLVARTSILRWFTRGLVFESLGRYEEALSAFQQAEQEQWPPTGEEIVYLFLGRQYSNLHRYAEARQAFDTAVKCDKCNPRYARAHIGLGNIDNAEAKEALAQAQAGGGSTDQVIALLDQAAAEYREAIVDAAEPSRTQTEIKGRIGLGNTLRFAGLVHVGRGEYATAETLFGSAVDVTTPATVLAGAGQEGLAAHAYLVLGSIYHEWARMQGDLGAQAASRRSYQSALDAYGQCIRIAEARPADSDLQDLKARYCALYSQYAQAELAEGGGK